MNFERYLYNDNDELFERYDELQREFLSPTNVLRLRKQARLISSNITYYKFHMMLQKFADIKLSDSIEYAGGEIVSQITKANQAFLQELKESQIPINLLANLRKQVANHISKPIKRPNLVLPRRDNHTETRVARANIKSASLRTQLGRFNLK